ncbi:craniofacial development protein 2-like [Harmonia axyridis]|uniref:craniofacial development protein 2-like n=1 Tax=Harmonia axyridis TaxID=115357 RepID=UPI001E2787B3|nr:craniofacial development protein 2-like [Harmonia axyridis]
MNTVLREKKNRWRKKTLRVACWNIMSWNTKSHEILLEIREHKVDICALSETKRKDKGTVKLPGYIFVYGGVDQCKRASAGVGILVAEKYEPFIDNIQYIDERILVLSLNSECGKTHIISVYAPDSSRKKEETDAFYERVEAEVRRIPSTEKVIILGDLNARVGNNVLPGIMNRFNEE